MHIVSSSCRYCRLSVQVDHDLKRKPNLLVDHMSCNMTENSTFSRIPPPPHASIYYYLECQEISRGQHR